MSKAKQPVSIAGIEFDALINSEESFTANVPEYPTEEGYSVSDNISLPPETISMMLFVTDTPVTWRKRHGTGRAESTIKRLKSLYFSKSVIEVITSSQVFSSMAITDMSITKNEDIGYAYEVGITLKKVIVTQTKTVSIPDSYGKSGETAAEAGTAETTELATETTAGQEQGKQEESHGSFLSKIIDLFK